MAITINGITYRNLQEQVEKNKEDIEDINTITDKFTYDPTYNTLTSNAGLDVNGTFEASESILCNSLSIANEDIQIHETNQNCFITFDGYGTLIIDRNDNSTSVRIDTDTVTIISEDSTFEFKSDGIYMNGNKITN